MIKKPFFLLSFFSIYILCVCGQKSKEDSIYDNFFISDGDTIRYHSKYSWFYSNVEWMENERTQLKALVDSNLNVLTDFKYDHAFTFYQGFNCGAASRDGKWGLVNKKGNEVTEFKYSRFLTLYLDTTINKEYFIFKKRNKIGVIDGDGNTVIPFKWKEVFYCNYAIFNLSKKKRNYLYHTKTGKIISINNYRLQNAFDKTGKTVLRDIKSDKYGVIDTSGTIIQPCIYGNRKDVEKFLK